MAYCETVTSPWNQPSSSSSPIAQQAQHQGGGENVQRYMGPCLISNRLSNSKGASRVFFGHSVEMAGQSSGANNGGSPNSVSRPKSSASNVTSGCPTIGSNNNSVSNGSPLHSLNSVTGMPLINFRFNRLNRKHGTNKSQYQQLRFNNNDDKSYLPTYFNDSSHVTNLNNACCSIDLGSLGVGLIAVDSSKRKLDPFSPVNSTYYSSCGNSPVYKKSAVKQTFSFPLKLCSPNNNNNDTCCCSCNRNANLSTTKPRSTGSSPTSALDSAPFLRCYCCQRDESPGLTTKALNQTSSASLDTSADSGLETSLETLISRRLNAKYNSVLNNNCNNANKSNRDGVKRRKKRRIKEMDSLCTTTLQQCKCEDCSRDDNTKPRTFSFCYLSLKRDNNAVNNSLSPPTATDSACTNSTLSSNDKNYYGSTPPLITIAVPPNCCFVKDDESLKLSASFSSSSDESSVMLSDDRDCQDSPDADSLDSFYADDLSVSPIDIVSVPPPPERQWLVTRSFERETPFATFTIMCYNILCDKYATSNLYAYCPSWALTWDYRKKYILSEITRHDTDIVALQEVETEQFYKFFKLELEPHGYSGTFSPKSRAKTMSEDERKYVDGCAIFWKSEKFELEKEHVIEFTRLAIAKADGSEHMLNRVMTRDNIALAAVFRIREGIYTNVQPAVQLNVSNSPLVICTAHIHWDPEFCDVKLVQSMMLTQELTTIVDRTAEQWQTPSQNVPVIVCGDLNSLPESGVYEFLTSGKISAEHMDFKDFKGQTCLQKLSSAPYLQDTYAHKLQLKSAYDMKMLPFTNYTYDFKGVIDYVFGSPGLVKLSVLGPMDLVWFQDNKIVGCPFPGIPSDHIPLLVHYAIIPPTLQQRLPAR